MRHSFDVSDLGLRKKIVFLQNIFLFFPIFDFLAHYQISERLS